MEKEWTGRWNHVRKFLERTGPFAHPDFEPSTEAISFLQEVCKILVIGAGGLGCELLKDLALLGFKNIDVIDMDTIDVSNLNRQFLFRAKDVGRAKAEVAAEFINKRVPGCNVTPHYKKIQNFDEAFYRQFHIVVCGLDSIVARRWINGMLKTEQQLERKKITLEGFDIVDKDHHFLVLCDGEFLEEQIIAKSSVMSERYGDEDLNIVLPLEIGLLNYEDGELDQTTVIPMIDGGTEGFKGNARVILPGLTACIECTLDLYPPQINFPLCTIAHTPRLPEHCIEYVRILLWPKENPFGENVSIDGDDPKHIQWILDKSTERAEQYNITGLTYRLTQGVVKRIIPAVASTNAVIAAACSTEVFKVATSCCLPLNNYMNFNDAEGIYTYTFEVQKKDDCLACSNIPQTLSFSENNKLQDIIDYLVESLAYQMKSPGITTSMNGKNKTLYMQTVKSIEEKTKENLKKTLKDLGLVDGQELYVADPTTPSSVSFKLNLGSSMEH